MIKRPRGICQQQQRLHGTALSVLTCAPCQPEIIITTVIIKITIVIITIIIMIIIIMMMIIIIIIVITAAHRILIISMIVIEDFLNLGAFAITISKHWPAELRLLRLGGPDGMALGRES